MGRRSSVSVGGLTVLGALVAFFTLVFGFDCFEAWAVMVGVGVAHSQWWHIIPTMGFWTSFILTILFMTPLNMSVASVSNKK